MKLTKNTNGFSHVMVVVLVVVVALVGLIGWSVWRANSRDDKKSNTQTEQLGGEALEGISEEDKDKPSSLKVVGFEKTVGETEAARSESGDAKVSLYPILNDGSDYKNVPDAMRARDYTINNGKRYDTIRIVVEVENIELSDCTIIDRYVPDDNPGDAETKQIERVKNQAYDAYDGDHRFLASCTKDGEKLESQFLLR